jgi:hypothetical protein
MAGATQRLDILRYIVGVVAVNVVGVKLAPAAAGFA